MKSYRNDLIKQLINDKNYLFGYCGAVYSRRVKRLISRQHYNGKSGKYYHKIKYKGKEIAAHRIIYSVFVGQLIDNMVIDHIDGNGLNNNVNNLRQITQKENMKNK